MSPPWWAPASTLPCTLADGLKWPPALLASAALQSPFSWMWMAWVLLGARPPISPRRCTPSPIGIAVSLPLTRLAEAEARLTVAELAVDTAAGAGVVGDIAGTVLQADSARATAAVSRRVFIGRTP